MLSTASALDIGKWKRALTAWVTHLHDTYGIKPVFAHVNKDMAEIGTLHDVWATKIQLCWWHLRQAVREQLAKTKLSTTPYNAHRAQAEFTFIDGTFVPPGKSDSSEREGGAANRYDVDGAPRPSPNAIPLCIPRPPTTVLPPVSHPVEPEQEPIPETLSHTVRDMHSEKITIKLPPRPAIKCGDKVKEE